MKNIGGEFIIELPCGDENVIPNQFTIVGAQQVLKSCFQQIPQTWYMGLCAHNQGDAVALSGVNEPVVANGYARQALGFNAVDWPIINQVNGESYVESKQVTFPLSGPTNITVNRLFLTDGTYIMAISSAFQSGLGFLSVPLNTKYRLYLR